MKIVFSTQLIHRSHFDHHHQASWSGLGTQEFSALPAAFGANQAAVQVLPPPAESSSLSPSSSSSSSSASSSSSSSSTALAYVQSLALPGRACYAGDQRAALATLAVCGATDEGASGGAGAVPVRADQAIAACPLPLAQSQSHASKLSTLVCFAVSVGHVSPFV